MPIVRDEPYGVFNFLVEIRPVSPDGKLARGAFSEVSGLDVEVPAVEYRTGNEAITMRKVQGLRKFSNLVLKRGIIGDLTFWNWIVAAMEGRVQRAEGSIVMLNEAREEVMRWNFRRAWPVKYTGPTFNAKNNEVALESIEIAYEGLEIDGQR